VLHARQHGLGARRLTSAGKDRPQVRRVNAAGFSFAVVGRGELLMLLPFKAMLLWRARAAENLAAHRCSHLLSRSRGMLLITKAPGFVAGLEGLNALDGLKVHGWQEQFVGHPL
jgi:hypothetical protein